jgi:polyphosphate kinase
VSTEKSVDTRYTQERELSWLRFNERVMDEARDESVPLFERLKFLSIFTSNLDEFFMIRVGSISDMTLSKQTHVDNKSGLTPAQQLHAIFKAVPPLYKQRDKLFFQLESRLRSCVWRSWM